jgi:hypothetical protein
LNVIVIISYSSAINVIVVIIIGNCAAVDIVVSHSAALNIIVGINTGVEVGAITVYCRGTGTCTITGAVIVGVNSTGAITGAVSVYQCFGIVAALINQCLGICCCDSKNHDITYYYFFKHDSSSFTFLLII